ncbi:hypothetical protein BD413DRAFT_617887 [Trametes elegans]|nr:hypothetical protein BD413DRAFT_617887 [Trametes elegans]
MRVRPHTPDTSTPRQTQRDKFTIHSKAVVCQDVELKGDITIGAGSLPLRTPSPTQA